MTQKKDIIVWGASSFAPKIADIIRLTGKYRIVGFLDDRENVQKGSSFCGAEILGGCEVLQSLFDNGVSELAFGFGNCHAKIELAQKVRELGFNLPAIVHVDATVADSARLGDGTIVGAGAVIEPNSVVGDCVLVNTRAIVAHDVVIGDGTHVGPGAIVCGKTKVGLISRIGAGATIIDGMNIGSETFIGAGSVVVRDIPDNVVAFGSPAKIIRRSDGKF
jgi:sugar O-acyltransferase (sialic acid O-acetyltransferase NeuD family)